MRPDIAAQADGWDPSTVTVGSNKRQQWKCAVGHTWLATPGNRTGPRGTGCPVCSGRQVLPGFNDLATRHPELAAQADGWDPSLVSPNSSEKRRWKCALGHTWEVRPAERVAGTGCPFCSRRAVLPGFNDLATLRPDVAVQADGWDPSQVMPSSMTKLPWVCNEGHRWITTPATRTRGRACPICAGKVVQVGYNDLATTHPEVAAQAVGWDPRTVTAGSNKRLPFRCSAGHVLELRVAQRSRSGCAACRGLVVIPGSNDLATTHPEFAAQADGWDPTTVIAGSNKNLPWKCGYGHTWVANPSNRTLQDQDCPVCTGRKVVAGFNDLATTHPELAMQVAGWDPSAVSRGSHAKKLWRCAEGHEWVATVKDRVAGYGCPTCAPSGFDPKQDAFLYFIEHDALDLLQVGITNSLEARLAAHGRRGWVVREVRGPMDGALTRATEQAVLRSIAKRGAVMAASTDIEKFDGWTEAWTRQSLDVSSLKQLLDFVYEDESPT